MPTIMAATHWVSSELPRSGATPTKARFWMSSCSSLSNCDSKSSSDPLPGCDVVVDAAAIIGADGASEERVSEGGDELALSLWALRASNFVMNSCRDP